MKIGIIGFGDLGQQIFQFLHQDALYKKARYYIFDDMLSRNNMGVVFI